MMKDRGRTPQPTRRRGRTLARAVATTSTVLVASFLVINSASSVSALPSPRALYNPSAPLQRSDERARGWSSVGNAADTAAQARANAADAISWDVGRVADVGGGIGSPPTDDDHPKQLQFMNPNRNRIQPSSRDQPSPSSVQHMLGKRATTSTTSTTGAATKSVNAAAFTSNLANSWISGRRSVWFQRKAVIITAVFLAIFIVLIIGCVVFLRGKRDDDLEEEYDVSDEAALARMREEREMRLGSRSEKKNKRRRKKDDGSSSITRGENGGNSTAIAVSKWARIPTRKIRIRKTNSKDSSSSNEKASANTLTSTTSDRQRNEQSSLSISAGARESGGESSGSNLSETPVESNGEVRFDSAVEGDSVQPHSSTGHEADSPAQDTQASSASTSNSDTSRGHAVAGSSSRLNASDLAFAEEEEERMRLGDALPPAYIPSQRRRSQDAGHLLPSSSRRLAGQEEAIAEARGDTKQADRAQSALANSSAANDRPPSIDARYSGDTANARRQTGDSAALDRYVAHVATDDKAVLAQMRGAASRPDASTPLYTAAPGASSAPIAEEENGASSHLASAPTFPDEDAEPGSDESHLHSSNPEAERESEVKGKEANVSSSRLPAPPPRPEPVTFSRFDLPYHDALSRRQEASTPSALSAEGSKAREAAAEEEQAMSLLASEPLLPRYDGGKDGKSPRAPPNALPSAPPALDDHDGDHHGDSVGEDNASASAPSAPPMPSNATAEAIAPADIDDEAEGRPS